MLLSSKLPTYKLMILDIFSIYFFIGLWKQRPIRCVVQFSVSAGRLKDVVLSQVEIIIIPDNFISIVMLSYYYLEKLNNPLIIPWLFPTTLFSLLSHFFPDKLYNPSNPMVIPDNFLSHCSGKFVSCDYIVIHEKLTTLHPKFVLTVQCTLYCTMYIMTILWTVWNSM